MHKCLTLFDKRDLVVLGFCSNRKRARLWLLVTDQHVDDTINGLLNWLRVVAPTLPVEIADHRVLQRKKISISHKIKKRAGDSTTWSLRMRSRPLRVEPIMRRTSSRTRRMPSSLSRFLASGRSLMHCGALASSSSRKSDRIASGTNTWRRSSYFSHSRSWMDVSNRQFLPKKKKKPKKV